MYIYLTIGIFSAHFLFYSFNNIVFNFKNRLIIYRFQTKMDYIIFYKLQNFKINVNKSKIAKVTFFS